MTQPVQIDVQYHPIDKTPALYTRDPEDLTWNATPILKQTIKETARYKELG